MSKLETALKEWLSLGFINPEQANRIRTYESTKPSRAWILSGLLILGATIIGIGIISLVAANWQQIPDVIKLLANFALLIGCSIWILRAWHLKKYLQFEVLLLFFLILCLASIGLIAQIYQTGGNLYQALMLWSLITFAVATAARQMSVPLIWTAGFLSSLVYAALNAPILQPIFHENYQAIFMTITLLCVCSMMLSKKLVIENAFTRALQIWVLISGLMSLVVAELYHFLHLIFTDSLMAYIPGYFLAIIAALSILLDSGYHEIQKLLLILALLVFVLLMHLPFLLVHTGMMYACCTIFILGLMAIFFASLQKRRLFQWFLFFISMRFLILYFHTLGGLITTGTGLIISGVLVITMAMLWHKYRTRLAIWAERWAR